MRHLFGHGGGLDGGFRVLADGERTMVLHEHGRGLRILLQGFDHAFADGFGADEAERADRHRAADSSPIMVRPHGMFWPVATHAVA